MDPPKIAITSQAVGKDESQSGRPSPPCLPDGGSQPFLRCALGHDQPCSCDLECGQGQRLVGSPPSPVATYSFRGATSSYFSSPSERLSMSDLISAQPFVVTKAVSTVYYKGLPSEPVLIGTTKPAPFEHPTGPEAYSVLKELRYLGNHPLATVWESLVAPQLCHALNGMGVKWTSLDAVHIANVGETPGPAIVWIGVREKALSFEEGSEVAINCQRIVNTSGIHDCYVEIRQSEVIRLARSRFLDQVLPLDPTFTARDPFTATLGIPICAKERPWAEGTGGFYLSAGGNDKNIYLLTARHVVLPVHHDLNKEYYRQHKSQPREDIIVLGTSGFKEKLAAINDQISSQETARIDATEIIHALQGMHDTSSRLVYKHAKIDLERTARGLEKLKLLHHEIVTHWTERGNRVFGELTWAPPILLSTTPGQYTLDIAIIKIKVNMLDSNNYSGNTINIGNKYSRHEFMKKIYPHHTSPTSFTFPPTRLIKLAGQVPESALLKPPMLDADGEECLVVFKNGAMTSTTIGKANSVSSYTRTYFEGRYQESREWPIIATDMSSGAFSSKGDSGACVADAYSRVGGILTGGAGATESCDITYVTPISFIMKVLHASDHFKHAHLNPILP